MVTHFLVVTHSHSRSPASQAAPRRRFTTLYSPTSSVLQERNRNLVKSDKLTHTRSKATKMLHRFVFVLPSAVCARTFALATRAMATAEQRNVPKGSVLGLFRSLLRHSAKISNYNFREHAKRRSREEFREGRTLDAAGTMDKFTWGMEQLQVVKRYSVLSHFYKGEMSVIGK
jgi:hypothetical protein